MPKKADADSGLLKSGRRAMQEEKNGSSTTNFESIKNSLTNASLPELTATASDIVASLPISQMIEVITIFGGKIVGGIKYVKMNRRQMQTLGERLSAVVDAIQRLPHLPSAQKIYVEPLLRLMDTMAECAKWVEDYRNKNYLMRFLNGGSHNIKFEGFHKVLAEHVQDLQLGLNVQEWMDTERYNREREQDFQELKTNQRAILTQLKESMEAITGLRIQGHDRVDVMSKKMAAVELRFQQLLKNQSNAQSKSSSENEAILNENFLIDYCDFVFESKIAEGSYGKIYRGYLYRQDVVIKEINYRGQPDMRATFFRETKILSQLRSPYIVQLYAACSQPDRSCYVMEYMANGNLVSYLKKHPGLELQLRHQLVLEISLGLAYLHHHNITHGDLRTANILVNESGRAKLSNFGFSMAPDLHRLPQLPANSTMRSSSYLAPEVLLGSPYTKASDVFSFGVILWEALTGRKLYQNLDQEDAKRHVIFNGRERIPDTMLDFYAELLEDCWHEMPSKRPTISQIVDQLNIIGLNASQEFSSVVSKPYPTGPRIPSARSDMLYKQGIRLVLQEKDYAQAVRLLQQASNEGHTRARSDLAFMYLEGKGVEKNRFLAQQLLQKSAVEGHSRAMNALASMGAKANTNDMRAVSFWKAQSRKIKSLEEAESSCQQRLSV